METLYWRRPTAAEVADIGCTPEDYPEPHTVVADENWEAIQLFCKFSTQWRTGPGGPVGLDYGVIQYELGRAGIDGDAYRDTMDRLRIIEQAALQQIHKD